MLFAAQNTIRLDAVDSTNLFAQELLSNHKVANGTVIVSRNQTKGRGQRGSVWIAEPGTNLTFSVVLLPDKLDVSKQFLLNKSFCLAVYDFLAEKDLKKLAVKWPNDILINKKKISGMLIENVIRGEYIHSVVAGFGINVNQNNFGITLADTATSMRLEAARVFNLGELLNAVLACIERRYNQVLNNEQVLIDADYNKALFQLDEWCIYEANNKEFIGCIRGVNQEGQLIIEHRGGSHQLFANKEIRFKIFN